MAQMIQKKKRLIYVEQINTKQMDQLQALGYVVVIKGKQWIDKFLKLIDDHVI